MLYKGIRTDSNNKFQLLMSIRWQVIRITCFVMLIFLLSQSVKRCDALMTGAFRYTA